MSTEPPRLSHTRIITPRTDKARGQIRTCQQSILRCVRATKHYPRRLSSLFPVAQTTGHSMISAPMPRPITKILSLSSRYGRRISEYLENIDSKRICRRETGCGGRNEVGILTTGRKRLQECPWVTYYSVGGLSEFQIVESPRRPWRRQTTGPSRGGGGARPGPKDAHAHRLSAIRRIR